MNDQQDNRGALFKNKDRATDRHPVYSGPATVDGVDYFMDAWLNKSDRTGETYMSVKFKRKDKQHDGGASTQTVADEPNIPF